ncbi:MAG TPA: FliM/FliN family flagellar motor C-terminal domain-containing protein [Candidatus Acidoferrum sp.]|nr:FliM/FliN family flagellar motor C-terminal domain-containing protein [Candidatus Acidoferrum sp.]
MVIVPALPNEIRAAIPEELWMECAGLRCVLSVDLALSTFTVRDLLRLAPGAVLESNNPSGADVPVVVNASIVGWAEFEVMGQRIAVRITELA